MNEAQQAGSHGVVRGVLAGFAMNVIFGGLWFALLFVGGNQGWLAAGQNVVFWSLFFIGATQLLYIGPAIWYYQRKREPALVKGLIIAAGLTALLNGACWAVLKS